MIRFLLEHLLLGVRIILAHIAVQFRLFRITPGHAVRDVAVFLEVTEDFVDRSFSRKLVFFVLEVYGHDDEFDLS